MLASNIDLLTGVNTNAAIIIRKINKGINVKYINRHLLGIPNSFHDKRFTDTEAVEIPICFPISSYTDH